MSNVIRSGADAETHQRAKKRIETERIRAEADVTKNPKLEQKPMSPKPKRVPMPK